jgi:hypothetical protein
MGASKAGRQALKHDDIAQALLAGYASDPRALCVSQGYLPSREAIVEILGLVLDLMYPGYFARELERACRGSGRSLGAQGRARDRELPVLRPGAQQRRDGIGNGPEGRVLAPRA